MSQKECAEISKAKKRNEERQVVANFHVMQKYEKAEKSF